MFSNTPNISDYETFLFSVAGIPPTALAGAVIDPSVAPVLSQTAGGALPATTYYVVYTYTNANGETLASPEASLAVDADNLLAVAAPAAATGATGWSAYVGLASGAETLQAAVAIGTGWTEPEAGLVVGTPLPTANTTEAVAIQVSFDVALEVVNITLSQATSQLYVLAVYNLATDRLINYAVDLPGQDYFANLRSQWNLNAPVAGVATSGSDQSTSSSWLNPEQLKTLTLANLQQMRTPFGLSYLGFAQSYGQTLWGLT